MAVGHADGDRNGGGSNESGNGGGRAERTRSSTFWEDTPFAAAAGTVGQHRESSTSVTPGSSLINREQRQTETSLFSLSARLSAKLSGYLEEPLEDDRQRWNQGVPREEDEGAAYSWPYHRFCFQGAQTPRRRLLLHFLVVLCLPPLLGAGLFGLIPLGDPAARPLWEHQWPFNLVLVPLGATVGGGCFVIWISAALRWTTTRGGRTGGSGGGGGGDSNRNLSAVGVQVTAAGRTATGTTTTGSSRDRRTSSTVSLGFSRSTGQLSAGYLLLCTAAFVSTNWAFFAIFAQVWAFPIPMGALLGSLVAAPPALVLVVHGAIGWSVVRGASRHQLIAFFANVSNLFLPVLLLVVFQFYRYMYKSSDRATQTVLAPLWPIVKIAFKVAGEKLSIKGGHPDFAPMNEMVYELFGTLCANMLFIDSKGIGSVGTLIFVELAANLVMAARIMFHIQRHQSLGDARRRRLEDAVLFSQQEMLIHQQHIIDNLHATLHSNQQVTVHHEAAIEALAARMDKMQGVATTPQQGQVHSRSRRMPSPVVIAGGSPRESKTSAGDGDQHDGSGECSSPFSPTAKKEMDALIQRPSAEASRRRIRQLQRFNTASSKEHRDRFADKRSTVTQYFADGSLQNADMGHAMLKEMHKDATKAILIARDEAIFLVIVLVTNEVCEIVVSLWSMLMFTLFYFGPNKGQLQGFQNMSLAEFERTIQYAALDGGVQLITLILVLVFLQFNFRVRAAAIFVRFLELQKLFPVVHAMCFFATAVTPYFIVMHAGMDPSFRFSWLAIVNATSQAAGNSSSSSSNQSL